MAVFPALCINTYDTQLGPSFSNCFKKAEDNSITFLNISPSG